MSKVKSARPAVASVFMLVLLFIVRVIGLSEVVVRMLLVSWTSLSGNVRSLLAWGFVDFFFFFFFQAEDGIRDGHVTGVQTCALPIFFAGTAEMIEKIGVRPPMTLEEFINKHRAAFAA